MPALMVNASTTLSAPIERVHDTLTDFSTWPIWSPWLYIEPEATVTYAGSKGKTGHGYQWTGAKVGAGSMNLTALTPTRIDCDLEFLKPFKSKATVWFDLTQQSSGDTQVSWNMDSRLPFFMFWMKDSMTGMIKADYRRGLALLKDYVETGTVRSKTTLLGTEDVTAEAYVGLQVVTSFDQLSSSMSVTFGQLADKANDGSFTPDGNAFCLYDEMNFKRDEITYTAAIPVDKPLSIDKPVISQNRPACRALKAVHTGAYHHLGSAWAMLMGEARTNKLKLSKTIPPFEYYLNNADTTLPSELITELYLPLR